ncbi:MAG: class I SAM-dependent methyltransferase [Clostridia bacterium]|nr:class I SAM-dependent methyltransferase [Clostridia bacterium]
MESMNDRMDYYMASAYVRGAQKNGRLSGVPEGLMNKELCDLTDEDMRVLARLGKEAELKMHYFKSMESLPRVKMALGFLKAVAPESLLDVGSGRGAFLFPFLREFPYVSVTSIDLLDRRVEVLKDMSAGGIDNLTAEKMDLTRANFTDKSFDAVTLLEVLEHIPDTYQAVRAALRLSKRYVVVTVPNKPDDNPEHIHLFTKESLTEIFMDAGAKKLSFDGVPGHMFMAARTS